MDTDKSGAIGMISSQRKSSFINMFINLPKSVKYEQRIDGILKGKEEKAEYYESNSTSSCVYVANPINSNYQK